MRRHLIASCVAGACVLGCSQPSAERIADPAPPRAEVESAVTAFSDYDIGAATSHENLTIFPISSKTPKNDDRFITLDEGLKAGTVKIIEVGAEEGDDTDDAEAETLSAQPQESLNQEAPPGPENGNTVGQSQTDVVQTDPGDLFGEPQQDSAAPEADAPSGGNDENPFGLSDEPEVDGDVNRLLVLNTSGKPLYLMPGEVISGGKQDRTIGQEVVIESGEKAVPIDVFCVEHGRWAGRGVAGTTSQLAAAADFDSNLSLVVSQTATVEELAEQSQRGKFVASVGQLNKDARLAVQEARAQDKVWEEVAKTNSKVGNKSESGNFAAAYFSGEVTKDFQPFINELKPIGETKQIVGVAVAVNGKMLSVDVFESTPMFKKFWPKLLKSYALDAVAATSEKKSGEKPNTVAIEDCIAFLNEVAKSQAITEDRADGQKIAKRRSSVGTSFTYYDAQAAETAGVTKDSSPSDIGGAFGGGVHTSVLAK